MTASERERERVSEHFSHSTVYDDGGSRRGVKLTWNWEKSQSQPSERASEQQEGKAEQNRAQSPGLHGRIVVVVLVLVVVVVGVSI